MQVSGYSVEGGLKDAEKTALLVSEHHCNVLTTEIEHVNADALEALSKKGTDLQPSANTIRTIQDKYIQKEHFQKAGIALPRFMKTDTIDEVKEAGR